MRNWICEIRNALVLEDGREVLSRKNLDNSSAASADDPPAVLAPDNGTYALAAHDAVAGYFLCATSSFEGPEAEARVVAGGNKLTAIRRKGQRGYGRRMCEHGVCALACFS